MPSSRLPALTDRLSRFIAEFAVGTLPGDVFGKTHELVYDGIGALAAASNRSFSTGRIIADFVRGQGGNEQASVIGHGFRTSVVNAALANGTMGYACDIEPHHPEAILHPVAVMVPTSLAIAEANGLAGNRLIAAVALGLEVEYRVSVSLRPRELYALGFHPSAVAGCFGACAAASWLLGLDASQAQNALGLAACQASGMMAWQSDPTENARPFQMGVAARNGVTAAMLAGQGFGGPAGIFDSGHTVYHAFSRDPAPGLLTARLGEDWLGITEMAIKPYPCVSFLHPGLDALLDLVRTNDLQPQDVESLEMKFSEAGRHCVDGNPLKSHCAQYILPVAFVHRELRIEDIFIDQREKDAAVADLCGKVTVVADKALDDLFPEYYATILNVRMKNGRTFTVRKDVARGYPESPLSGEEIRAKFHSLVATVSPSARALSDTIDRLHTSSSVTELAALLRQLGKN